MKWQEQLIELSITYGGRLLVGILIYLIGKKLIQIIVNKITNKGKEKLDKTLFPFIKSISSTSLYILLFITIGSTLGLKMSSFIAVFSAIAFAVGLSLQGSLSNFAGGILILTFRPFNVDDFIEIPGNNLKGKVTSITILYTTLLTRDNKQIVIPNGDLSNSNVINYSPEEERRVDLTFGIGYDDDFTRAKQLLKDITTNHELILEEPEPLIRVGEHADSSININCYVWCKTENYWDVYYDLLEEVKLVFDQEGINIPYPQMDVHVMEN